MRLLVRGRNCMCHNALRSMARGGIPGRILMGRLVATRGVIWGDLLDSYDDVCKFLQSDTGEIGDNNAECRW